MGWIDGWLRCWCWRESGKIPLGKFLVLVLGLFLLCCQYQRDSGPVAVAVDFYRYDCPLQLERTCRACRSLVFVKPKPG